MRMHVDIADEPIEVKCDLPSKDAIVALVQNRSLSADEIKRFNSFAFAHSQWKPLSIEISRSVSEKTGRDWRLITRAETFVRFIIECMIGTGSDWIPFGRADFNRMFDSQSFSSQSLTKSLISRGVLKCQKGNNQGVKSLWTLGDNVGSKVKSEVEKLRKEHKAKS